MEVRETPRRTMSACEDRLPRARHRADEVLHRIDSSEVGVIRAVDGARDARRMTAREIRQDVHRWTHESTAGTRRSSRASTTSERRTSVTMVWKTAMRSPSSIRGARYNDLLNALHLGEGAMRMEPSSKLSGRCEDDFACGVAERIGNNQHGGRKLVGLRRHRCTSGMQGTLAMVLSVP